MAAKMTLLQNPTFNLTFPAPCDLKTSVFRFSASKTAFFGGFGFQVVRSNTVTKLVKTSALRSGDGEKKVGGAFQHEAFLKASIGSRSEFMAAEALEATLNQLSKWIVFALFVAVLFWRNDAESLWIAMGSVINFIVCITLKWIFNQQRPVSTLKSDPGMPSSHAQSIFYIFMISVMSVMERLGVNEITLTVTALALACGSYLSWLRVCQQYHTISQVVVGAAVGSIFSAMWFWLWHAIVLEAFVSFLWVRTVVVLGTAAFSFCFLLYVIRNWILQ
ncbi:hypothetical protein JCGZ_22169 [Jatropha curcas]|uniref:Phosphatidic acid phosphatase type 2/haloperoxidase domain-containing protein n=1 Tax=Jatropha curcas TaxID=180498 RepID=A0A067L841_JATCU|nr:hypothetical protein JCGZ_22169 [Jatropha curcas]